MTALTRFFMATALVAAIGSSAEAAEEFTTKSIAACASIQGNLERLQCFDDLAKALNVEGPQAQPVPTSGVGKWRVSRTKNPVDDTETVALALPADTGKSRFGNPVALVIRCASNHTQVFINWNSYLGGDSPSVLTRVGTEKAETKSWSKSTDNTATFVPGDDVSFVKKLLKSGTFVSQVTPYNESPITATFDTSGLTEAIKPVQEVCHWS